MTTPTLTLTEFLLARIAEDEAVVDIDSRDRDAFGPARMRAECEAKRRIVERCRWAASHPHWANDMEIATQHEDAMNTLHDIASIYSDHPDCREEWKP